MYTLTSSIQYCDGGSKQCDSDNRKTGKKEAVHLYLQTKCSCI